MVVVAVVVIVRNIRVAVSSNGYGDGSSGSCGGVGSCDGASAYVDISCGNCGSDGGSRVEAAC